MIRICSSLQNSGFDVLLVGVKSHKPIILKGFSQKRLTCISKKGKSFYIEYNIRLFLFLLFHKFDLTCAIDLDTIIPCYLASVLKRKKRVYDAHELFCEMKEVVSRPFTYRVWKKIERNFVPRFTYGYTVNTYIRDILKKDYNVTYDIVRNMPALDAGLKISIPENFILYQGAVNHGRSFETLIPAFQWINVPLFIYGKGNFENEVEQLIKDYKLQDKVFLKGPIEPDSLREITTKALLGVTIFENKGLSNYYSLANRFFDYMHAGIPQVCVDYPAYQEINEQYKVAVLIKDISSQHLANTINSILIDKKLQTELRQNCVMARKVFNWQTEEKTLINFYQFIFRPALP
jgi:glycosyltransferase involved in cell wall biosynthesis